MEARLSKYRPGVHDCDQSSNHTCLSWALVTHLRFQRPNNMHLDPINPKIQERLTAVPETKLVSSSPFSRCMSC